MSQEKENQKNKEELRLKKELIDQLEKKQERGIAELEKLFEKEEFGNKAAVSRIIDELKHDQRKKTSLIDISDLELDSQFLEDKNDLLQTMH